MPASNNVVPPTIRRHARLWLGVLAVAALAACGDSGNGQAGPAGGGMPPPQVGVVTVAPHAVGLVDELPGRLEASRVAQVRARASGILEKRLFREGSDVKAGQPLFEIDAAPYRAALQSAQANVARAEALRAQAKAQADRFEPLVKAHAISQQEYVNAVAALKTAEADIAAGRAAVQTAQINLGHARVTAPISGRIGRALVTEGALVGTGEATQLAVIQQIDPMYVNFTQSTTEVLALRRALAAGRLERSGDGARVQIVLDDGSTYGHPAKLLFTDLSVDPTSGQVTLRASVPNPDGFLLPGMYVRVRIEQAQLENAVTLPQQAVTRSPQGDTVMVVGAENKPEPRPVTVGNAQQGQWVILDGLKAGEQVIVDGFQKMRPGAPVTPVPWGKAGGAPGAGGSASAPASAASR